MDIISWNDNMKKLLFYLLVILISSPCWAGTTTVSMTDTFPYKMSTQNETYQLSENITCDTTCFSVANSGITLDLNGKILIFGNANGVSITNNWFENWTDINTPVGWTIVSGTATRVASYWPDQTYDAELSVTAVIKSNTVTLIANQTYWYGAWIRGNSADSYTVSIRLASDDSVLATATETDNMLNRGFASEGYINSTDHLYKPTVNQDVYLRIDCLGANGIKRISVADIAPTKHYGVFHRRYKGTPEYYAPDLSDTFFGGTPTTTVIKYGKIVHGNGKSAQSYGVLFYNDYNDSSMTLQDLIINMNGHNTGAVLVNNGSAPTTGNILIDNVDTNTGSRSQFNRMHPVPEFEIFVPSNSGATVEIKNCSVLNFPEYGMVLNGAAPNLVNSSTTVHNNTIRGLAQVTEPYQILLVNGNNISIYDNILQPYRGRGILSDSTWGVAPWNVSIYNNQILDIYEKRNLEYAANSLEAIGINIRNFGDDPYKNWKIYGNTITTSTDAAGVHATYGIDLKISDPEDDIEIYNNTITANQTGQDLAACIAFEPQSADAGGLRKIHNNVCISNSRGIQFGGNDGAYAQNALIYLNKITTLSHAFYFYGYTGLYAGLDTYCNQITNTGTSSYPFYFDDATYAPTVSDIMISNNLLTNSNSGGYEVYTTRNYSSSVIFCANGTIDVDGGGSVGSASPPCQDGSTGCYSTAGLTGGGSSTGTIGPGVTIQGGSWR